MEMRVITIGERVEIDWNAEHPFDTIKNTGQMCATLRTPNGQKITVDLNIGAPEVQIGDVICIEEV